MIRILVVEDSAVQRELLLFILEEEPDFEVVGTAADGLQAIEMTERLRPDIILMDIHMPRLDGIGATREIMEKYPTPIVICSASLLPDDVHQTFDAIKVGALAVLSKPAGLGNPKADHDAAELVKTLRLMSEVKVVARRVKLRTKAIVDGRRAIQAVAIAGSTGAPGVIADILSIVGPELPVPVLVVQHMAVGFVAGFATWLGRVGGPKPFVAVHGQRAERGCVYLAPDGKQMGLDSAGGIELSDTEPEEGFRPSASYLFRSVAQICGASAIGVLLTGMGRDGATGLLRLRDVGGVTIVQDEASSVVFGMPKEAIKLGAAAHILPPDDIAKLILTTVGQK